MKQMRTATDNHGDNLNQPISRKIYNFLGLVATDKLQDRLAEQCVRAKLILRLRWAIIAIFWLYIFIAELLLPETSSLPFLHGKQWSISLILTTACCVLIYTLLSFPNNSTQKRCHLISYLQVFLDLLFVTVAIHLSGGSVSWFWPAYLLVSLESVFLFDTEREVWWFGLTGALLYGLLLTTEQLGIIIPIRMPLGSPAQVPNVFAILIWFWVAGLNTMVAFFGALLMGKIRRDHDTLREHQELLLKHQRQLEALNTDLKQKVEEEVRINREKDTLLLQQEKLASVGQLAAGIAHEINNPMGFIMSNLSSLEKYVDSILQYFLKSADIVERHASDTERAMLNDAKRHHDLDFIVDDIKNLLKESTEGAERVKTIVLALKDFARPDQKVPVVADINSLIHTTLTVVGSDCLAHHKVELDLHDVPPLLCHPGQISQVIACLLINAAHATDQQGCINIGTSSQDNEVVISIADNGCGIPDSIVHRIFDPFFTTKPVGKGVGLGLTVCRNIVHHHGGTIMVESKIKPGTRAIVKLPLIKNMPVCLDRAC